MKLSDGKTGREWIHMDPGLFLRIQRQVFPGALTVGLSCGAEPFCNPRIGEHLKALCDSGVPGRELVTNGTLLDPDKLTLLVRYPPTTLFVSIDGSNPETHRRIRGGANLDHIIQNLEKLRALRGPRRFPMIALSTTLQRDNFLEIPGIVRLAARVGACAVGVVPLVPYRGLSTLDRVVSPDSSRVSRSLAEAGATAARLGVSFSVSWEAGGRKATRCPYIDSTVYISADGSVYPCPYWNTGNPLGNLAEEDFREVWKRRHRSLTPETCHHCPEATSDSREVVKDF